MRPANLSEKDDITAMPSVSVAWPYRMLSRQMCMLLHARDVLPSSLSS